VNASGVESRLEPFFSECCAKAVKGILDLEALPEPALTKILPIRHDSRGEDIHGPDIRDYISSLQEVSRQILPYEDLLGLFDYIDAKSSNQFAATLMLENQRSPAGMDELLDAYENVREALMDWKESDGRSAHLRMRGAHLLMDLRWEAKLLRDLCGSLQSLAAKSHILCMHSHRLSLRRKTHRDVLQAFSKSALSVVDAYHLELDEVHCGEDSSAFVWLKLDAYHSQKGDFTRIHEKRSGLMKPENTRLVCSRKFDDIIYVVRSSMTTSKERDVFSSQCETIRKRVKEGNIAQVGQWLDIMAKQSPRDAFKALLKE
jgi:hypothetical protein